MKQQGLITTLIIVALIIGGLYFAWTYVLKDMIADMRSAAVGKAATEMVGDVAGTIGGLVK